MSAIRANTEIDRFLGTSTAETISISGQWGVGKTHAWRSGIDRIRATKTYSLKRYSYVSLFGLSSLTDLKTAIFQQTVKLDAAEIAPTLASFKEHSSDLEGMGRIAEWVGRKLAKSGANIASMIPFVGSSGELLLPGVSLLIRNQIICIDDIERSGDGLKFEELLGFVSLMKEQRNCKIVLLLNKDGLGERSETFDRYLEKVVDQSIEFKPTPAESVALALDQNDELQNALGEICEKLEIVNIRLIRRIWRFACHVKDALSDFDAGVLKQALQTLAVFGWCIFERDQAPSLDYVREYSRFSGIFDNNQGPNETEARWNAILDSAGFAGVDDFDNVLIDGLVAGAFDLDRLRREARILHDQYINSEARAGIQKPWTLFGGSLADDEPEIIQEFIASVESFAEFMSVSDINSVMVMLRDLDQGVSADECLEKFLTANAGKSRAFFQLSSHHPIRQRIDPALAAAFENELETRPVERDPAEVLMNIERRSGWNPEDLEFLASLSEEKIYDIIRAAKGDNLHDMIRSATRFVASDSGPAAYGEFGEKARNVMRRISRESRLNRFRLSPYLPDELGGDEQDQEKPIQ